jgi:D-arabinose 5-phosphate isomerase GutQ
VAGLRISMPLVQVEHILDEAHHLIVAGDGRSGIIVVTILY